MAAIHTPDPLRRAPGARPAAADADARSLAAAAGPQPAPDRSDLEPSEPHADGGRRLRGPVRALRGAARRHGREPAPRGRSRRAELPALAAATFALSKLVVHEKAETWVRRPFVEEDGPPAQGAPAALRRRRAAHVHALHGRVGRARARGPAPARPARRPDGHPGARRLGRQRHPPGRLLLAVRARDDRAASGRADLAFRTGTSRRMDVPLFGRPVSASGTVRRRRAPGVSERVTSHGQLTYSRSLRAVGGVRHDRRPTSRSPFPHALRTLR